MSSAAHYKEEMRKEWTTAAPGWRKWDHLLSEGFREASEKLLDAAGLSPGMHVLDLASGSGEPALSAARRVAPDGRVLATDLVPEMLSIAEEKARRAGITNFEARPCDAEALPFEDGSFDAVTCRFGIMFFPQPKAALDNVRRVLRPGGRAAFVAWGTVAANPYFNIPLGHLAKYASFPEPDPERPNPFKYAAPGVMESRLKEGGFRLVREERLNVTIQQSLSPDRYLEAFSDIAAPFRPLVEGLPPADRSRLADELAQTLHQYWDGTFLRLPAEIVLGVGVK